MGDWQRLCNLSHLVSFISTVTALCFFSFARICGLPKPPHLAIAIHPLSLIESSPRTILHLICYFCSQVTMLHSSKSSLTNARPISMSSVQSENQIRQYRLEQQIENQNTAMEFLQSFLSISLSSNDPHAALRDGVTLCM